MVQQINLQKKIIEYTIAYTNEEVQNLFQKIEAKTKNKAIIKPVFMKNKENKYVAYFKVKMNGEDSKTKFYFDKKKCCNKIFYLVTTFFLLK